MSAINAVTAAIKAFDFEDYGLHEVDPTSEYAEWVPALAAAVHAAARPEVLTEAADAVEHAFHNEPFLNYPPDFAAHLRELAGKDTGGTPAGESTPPAPDTDASTAFMQLGTTPSLAGLRAELHIEGHPPIIGRYAGFGSRSVGDGEALLIEPALLFHWTAEDQPEGEVPRG